MNSKKRCVKCKSYFRNKEVTKTLIGNVCNSCLSDPSLFRQDKPRKPIARSPIKSVSRKAKAVQRKIRTNKTVPVLKKILTKHFNEYIRLRDTDKDGRGRCICCNKPIILGKNAHAGHFIPSTYSATRYDENNVHLQNSGCNTFKHGNLTEYEENLRRKIGNEAVELLKIKKHNKVKWSTGVLQILIDQYKAKVKKERRRKTCFNS